ncbi:MAG: hypothetical protein AABW56_00390 [Nanoarchaeota archaeon]
MKFDIFKRIFNKELKVRTYQIKNLKEYIEKKKEYKLKFNPRVQRLKNHKNLKVFVVNGELIRDNVDIDFVMGGNGARYLYIPINEIWVESKYKKELKDILLHEYSELNLMKKGYNYEKAHDLASIKELKLRTKS